MAGRAVRGSLHMVFILFIIFHMHHTLVYFYEQCTEDRTDRQSLKLTVIVDKYQGLLSLAHLEIDGR
jgi:hypothetical protein